MDFKGTLRDYQKSWKDGKGVLSFTVLNIGTDYLQEISGKDLRISVKEWKERRSLNSNAYYWQLVGKIADKMRISKPHCHNLMMRRYGQTEFFDNQIAYTMLPDTDKTQAIMDEMEEAHFAPTSMTREGKDGTRFRAWKLLKPSHRFDTKEMSILIDGIVSDAKELGIETLPEDEIRRMKEQWGVNL